MGKENRRMTIGVLVGGIMDEFTKLISRGVMQMAKQLDVNVVVLPGKYLDRDLSDNPELMYEYQFNTAFSYARPDNMDAIIIASSTIGCFTDREHIEELLSQYKDIPSVLIADKMDGYVGVLYDNYNGIKEGLEYLIEKAGCRKFGMIGGSEDNNDARERKTAFVETLEKHGIPFSEKMYVAGDFTRRCYDTYRMLLDNNPELEAVFCVNDDTAIGFYEEVKKRGLQIGKDIRIFGYDDMVLSTKMDPPLSSVQADGTTLGEEALKLVMKLVHGEKVENKILPTKFIKRGSVGASEVENESQQARLKEAADTEVYFHDIFYRSNHGDFKAPLEKIRNAFEKLIQMLICVYGEGDDSPENIMEIQNALSDFLNYGAIEYADVNNLMNCLESLHATLKNVQESRAEKYKLQEMFSAIYRKIIRATEHRFGRMLDKQEKEGYSIKLFVRDMLQFEKGNDLSYASLLGNLEWLDIKNAYIYAFKEPVMHLFREQFQPPEYLDLKAILVDGNVSTVSSLRQKVEVKDVFRRVFYNAQKRSTYVCLPLFANEMLYGLLICDLTEEVFANGEFLVNHMSSAAKMIMLLRSNEHIQQKLEESLLILKENNIALNNLSRLDGLTGILNRRGFYEEADRRLAEGRKENKSFLVIYIDMNNLKIINDRYGHDDGDFALNLIGTILSEEMGEKGIVGRIGGDEFACLTEYNVADDGVSLIGKLYERFNHFNQNSDKPYNVTVSAGGFSMNSQENVSLKEALTQADEKLYEVKKKRKKDVAK